MDILQKLWSIISGISILFTVMFLFFFFKNLHSELSIRRGIKTIQKDMKIVYVEHINNMWMMYDKFNHAFICQASTESELQLMATAMFPNKQILTISDDITIGRT